MKRARREPYTARGIGRVPCVKCGASSVHQWRICATDAWHAVCLDCDVEINRLVATWAFGPERGADLVRRYTQGSATCND